MARTTKRDWMMAAMEILVAEGVDSLTIEALTKKMGVTKGSFYHHFGDAQNFHTVMLEMCLYESTTSVIERVEQGETPYIRLMTLTEMAAQIDPIEVAIRAWALRDPDAHATLIEIDARRVEYVAKLFADLGLDAASAGHFARLYYTVFIGGHHLMPPLTTPHMHELFATIRQLAGVEPTSP
jgi:AcrR family transcriptional regulator